jgi:uncharacterized membrane protein
MSRTAAPARSTTSARWVPYALVALSAIPVVAGSLRLVEVFGGPHLMPHNARISASPAPVVVHILSVIPYAVLGAFQFSSRLRRRRPGWHQATGRVLVVLGLAVALSGLWMTLVYPRQTDTGVLAFLFRLAAGSGMAASIVLGFAAIRRRDVATHQAWMTRAYALALGAGTQTLTLGVAHAVLGSAVPSTDLGLGAGWVLNLVVAEVLIQHSRQRRPTRRGSLVVGVSAS